MQRRLQAWACVLVLAAVSSANTGHAQGLASVLGSAKKTVAPGTGAAADPWNRTTPRSSIEAFLEACHAKDFTRAQRYLDLSKLNREEEQSVGPERARQLAWLLDHDAQFEIGQLSDSPDGDPDDGLPPNVDELAIIGTDDQEVQLTLERQNRGSINVWLVSAGSVAKLPELASSVAESSVEKKLPAPLVGIKLLSTSLWVWMALVLLVLVLTFLSSLLSRAAFRLLTPITKRYAKNFNTERMTAFGGPTRLLLSIAVFRACEEAFTPSALLRQYLNNILTLLFFFGAASLTMRIVDVISDQVQTRLEPRQRALSSSVLPLFVRMVKICIFIIAALLTLEAWDYPVTTILAGVGVGGLAVALAAQKTIENLFGGVAVISDRPVLVGDFCQFGGQVGTIEDIGLRSTRIRTLDRTVVTIPNAQFSTMTLENYSRRDRMWFHPTLNLRRDTRPEQIRAVMDAVTRILNDHPLVDPTAVPVRFTKIEAQSFDIELFSYVLTPDFDQFLKTQSELLMTIVEEVGRLGVGFSIPVQESLITPATQEELKNFGVTVPGFSSNDGRPALADHALPVGSK